MTDSMKGVLDEAASGAGKFIGAATVAAIATGVSVLRARRNLRVGALQKSNEWFDVLRAMTWDGTRWVEHSLESAFSVQRTEDGVDVCYKEGQHGFARVYLKKKLVGDFSVHIEVKGDFSDLHVCAIDGLDLEFWGNPPQDHISVTERHSYAIIRHDGEIKMECDGSHKIEKQSWPKDVDPRMPCYVSICIHKGKTARIFSWDVIN